VAEDPLRLYVVSTEVNDLGNKGLLIGQKKALEPKHVWSIRVRLEITRSRPDLAIFNLAIDSKLLRACDLVKLRLDDICSGANVRHRATIVQSTSKCLLPNTLSSLPNAHSRQTNVGGKPPLRPPEGSRRQGGISRVTCCLLLNIARAF
jgi:hypothetical protein